MAEYQPAVGMECHAELLTQSKMFCGCENRFGGEPNTRCCPVCLGMPGSLPVINRTAVEHVIKTALALNCEINPLAGFDRKNYFYPDLPKGYQISEYDHPIGINGWIDVEADGKAVRVRIRRVHLEEDTGKLSHAVGGDSYVDLNRSGVPLMEIVTEFPPDIVTAAHARAYVQKLRSILLYLGACDGKMEEGSLRCEPNVSVRAAGSESYGVKTEIKNLNSLRALHDGVDFEVARQSALLESGGTVLQETRGWNETRRETFSQRSKEGEQEYRYFPEPDLMPLRLDTDWVERLRAEMPELPNARHARFVDAYGLSEYDAALMTDTRAMADYYETAVRESADYKGVSNWIMGDLARLNNGAGLGIEECPITPGNLAAMVNMIADGTISGKIAKTLIEEMFASGGPPGEIVDRKGWRTMKDIGALIAAVDRVMAENGPVVADIVERGLKQKTGFLVGQIMKATDGKADPKEVARLLQERLK